MKYKSIVIGALLAAIFLSVSMSLNYRNTTKIREYNLAVDRSEDAIQSLRLLLSTVNDAETGQRGYLLTGDEAYLKPYEESVSTIQEALDNAEQELADTPEIVQEFPQLRNLINNKLAELEATIRLRRERGYQPAARMFDTDQGRVLMERIHSLVTDLIEKERFLLTGRLKDSNDAYQIAIASGLLSGLSALVSIAALFLLVRRHVDEREKASRKITEQSELLRITLTSIGDGVITTDRSGHVTGMNEVAEGITSWTNDEAKDKSIKRVFPVYYSESGQEASHPVLTSIHSDEVVQTSHNIELQTKNGNRLFIDCSASPIVGDDDMTIGCVLTFKDNSEQRKREASLQKSEARLRAAFENTAVGIAHASPDERLVRVNQRLCEILGYTEQELIGRQFSEITYPDDLELTKNSLSNMLTGEYRSQQFQKRYIRKDGDVVWVNKTISLVRDSDNRPDYFITVIEDITERIATQDALKESEAHLRRVLDNTLTYICVLSPEGNVLEINRSALELNNQQYSQCIGKAFQALSWWNYDSNIVERLRGSIQKAANGEVVRYDETIRIQNDETATIDLIINPARNDEGEITHLIATGIDISDRKILEEELRVVAAELSLANKRKDEFLATLAHELRNPMAPIRTGLEILRLSQDDPVTMEQTREMMERQTEQLIRLVDDLLDVSRITRGKLELRKENVALKEILERAVESSKPVISSFGHELFTNFEDSQMTLFADPYRLAQVISNLLNNAAKYTNDGGKIYLNAKRDGKFVSISVEDNGVGLEPEMQELIFEMFGQVKTEGDLSTSGLGIGLTLARSLSEQHGGSISVESEGLNKGSKFTVKIPVNTSNMNPAIDTETSNLDARTPRRVLVVDDSPSILKTMSLVIKLQGHEVFTASDGQQAIERAAETRPDIIFMDIGMPRTNGYEAAKLMRKEPWGENLVIVALTGWGGDEVSQRVEESGFNHHIVKPPEPEDLKRLIASVQPKLTSENDGAGRK